MNDRRTLLAGLAAGVAAAAIPDIAGAVVAPVPAPASPDLPACRPGPEHFPNVEVWTHEGRRALFYDDLIRGRSVLLHFTSRAREAAYPVLANLARVAPLLGDRLGREVFLYSIAAEPERDSPRDLKELAERHGAGGGWLFLTGEPAAMAAIRGRLFVHDSAAHVHDQTHGHAQALSGAASGSTSDQDCSRGLLRYGNEALGLWGSVPAVADPRWIAERLEWIRPTNAVASASGAPRRKGPRPLAEQPWWSGSAEAVQCLGGEKRS